MSTQRCPFPSRAENESARMRVSSFIDAAQFPCVGAKSALNKGRMCFQHYAGLCDDISAMRLCDDLRSFSSEFPDPGGVPVSFVATFGAEDMDELQFESRMWRHIQLMHAYDRHKFAWDPAVSADPTHSNFSLSIAGRAFFVVGIHPRASRLARRAPLPSLVFNFHDQFISLKESGKYASMQKTIRARDTRLQGSVNPVLARFGDASEARQYSGRAVEDDWACPFRPVDGRPAWDIQHHA